jgi:ADP-heptose:LPS heptosyltransferase/Flp pilus assembly protein TadD
MTQPVKHWILQALGGLGNVCMTLCACRALRQLDPGCGIWMLVGGRHARLVAACPHVDETFTEARLLEEAMRERMDRNPDFRFRATDATSFDLDPLHPVDAYLASLEIRQASATMKSLELEVSQTLPAALASLPAPAEGRRRVIFHAGSGAPNSSWPKASWEALGRRVLNAGHQLLLIGGTSDPGTGTLHLDLPGAVGLVSPLDPLDAVALFRRADAFVSTDSGWIPLAGAADLAICGIHTTFAGHSRLPFRHGYPLWGTALVEPACVNRGCFRLLLAPQYAQDYAALMKKGGESRQRLLSAWCVEEDRYHCVREIHPDQVWDALEGWLSVPPLEREQVLDRMTGFAAEGRAAEALEGLETLPRIPSDLRATLLQARLLYQEGRCAEVLDPLRETLPLWPLQGEILNLIGLGNLRTGQLQQARTFLDLQRSANLLECSGDRVEVLAALRRNQAFLQVLEAMEAGDPLAAEAALAGLEAHPPVPDAVERAETLIVRLSLLLQQGRLAEAREVSDQAAAEGEAHPDLHYLRGMILLQDGDSLGARAAFQACLALDPSHALAAERLG